MSTSHFALLICTLIHALGPTALASSPNGHSSPSQEEHVSDTVEAPVPDSKPFPEELSNTKPTPEAHKKQRELADEMKVQRAWMSSVIIPGWGQVYNGHYSKVPVIYMLFASLGGAAIYNHSYYVQFIQGNNSFWLSAARDFGTLRDLFLIFMGMVYIGNVVDAYAGATLKRFDLSDNIGLALRPIGGVTKQKEINLGLSICFNIK